MMSGMPNPVEPRDRRVLWGWSRRRWLVSVVALVVAGALAAILFMPRLIAENWKAGATDPQYIWPAAQTVLFTAGGLIAVVGVVLSVSRHWDELDSSERDRLRLDAERVQELRSRFVDAVTLLSNENPVQRQAGLFALGALADDWSSRGNERESQVCVEVICAYLRAPLPDGLVDTPPAEIPVKSAGYDVIGDHLRPSASPHWHSRRINLTGAHIDFTVEWRDATFVNGSRVWLDRATIAGGGIVWLDRASITRGSAVWMNGARVTGGGRIWFNDAKIGGGGFVSLDEMAVGEDAFVSFDGAEVGEESRITLRDASVNEGGYVSFDAMQVRDRSHVSFSIAKIRGGGFVSLRGVSIDKAAHVTFEGARIEEAAHVELKEAEIEEGARILFDGAHIGEGGSLTLDGAVVSEDGPVRLTDGRGLSLQPTEP